MPVIKHLSPEEGGVLGMEGGRRLAHRAAETSLKGGGQGFIKVRNRKVHTDGRHRGTRVSFGEAGGRKPG